MNIDINTLFKTTVEGGPSISRQITTPVDAFDLIDVTIEDGASDELVELQPGDAGQVRFLLVLADSYDPALSYKINAGGNPSHDLDRELLLVGETAVGLLGFPPNDLLFTNGTGQAIAVRVLVGRTVTP